MMRSPRLKLRISGILLVTTGFIMLSMKIPDPESDWAYNYAQEHEPPRHPASVAGDSREIKTGYHRLSEAGDSREIMKARHLPMVEVKQATKSQEKGKPVTKSSASTLDVNNSIRYINESKVTGRSLQEVLPALRLLRRNFVPETLPFVKYGVNVTLSGDIPLDRDIEDTRPRECHHVRGSDSDSGSDKLPTFSVIIPVYNEVWSLLLRCLHSILRRSPEHLLVEVILVNDASEFANNRETLTRYVTHLPKVKVMRTRRREGLIRARILGAMAARGEVLVFLDAHTEVNAGWAEPLLATISADPHVLAVPWVDVIHAHTLAYQKPRVNSRGSFNWELEFTWVNLPSDLWDGGRRPFPTATASGCAMATDRDFFFKLGGFDEGMFIWGGENLEISFRTWMCGGSVLVHPCSRVGHVFRARLPYPLPDDILRQNVQRIADVWMGEHARNYYSTVGHKVNFTQAQLKSLDKRHKLREDLKCRSFTWYLNNVVKSYSTPGEADSLFGHMKNLASSKCMTATQAGSSLTMEACDDSSAYQTFHATNTSDITGEDGRCLTAHDGTVVVSMAECSGDANQKWPHVPFVASRLEPLAPPRWESRQTTGRIHLKSRWFADCLAATVTGDIIASRCDENDVRQYWTFSHKVFQSVKTRTSMFRPPA